MSGLAVNELAGERNGSDLRPPPERIGAARL
jgi:hypothetical protein